MENKYTQGLIAFTILIILLVAKCSHEAHTKKRTELRTEIEEAVYVFPMNLYYTAPVDEFTIQKIEERIETQWKGAHFKIDIVNTRIAGFGNSHIYEGGTTLDYAFLESEYKSDTLTALVFPVLESDVCEVNNEYIRCSLTSGWSIIGSKGNTFGLTNFALSRPDIISHELGHFFGLKHTFDATENISDTPYDPSVVYEVFVNYDDCVMEHSLYKPMVNNIMAYYHNCKFKDKEFTEQQDSVLIENIKNSTLVHYVIKNKKDDRKTKK